MTRQRTRNSVMHRIPLALATGLLLATAAPALAASCADEIAALDRRLKDEATSAISSTTGSKEVSLSRQAEAVDARNADKPVTAMPHAAPSGSPEANATKRAEQAGGAGDRVMQARATLNRAHTLQQRGDQAGCLDAVQKAKRQLDN